MSKEVLPQIEPDEIEYFMENGSSFYGKGIPETLMEMEAEKKKILASYTPCSKSLHLIKLLCWVVVLLIAFNGYALWKLDVAAVCHSALFR